jgi:hypothetical protein
MKNKNLIQILLGSGLALQVCATPVPQPDIFTVASDFSVIGSPGSGTLSQSSAENFSAAGNASSDVDGSSVYGAQSLSCAGGTFIGLGSVSVNAGMYLGNAGVTSVYILFEVTNTSHYQFVSSCLPFGNVRGTIAFNGLVNSDGTVMANGTLQAG